MSSTWTTGVAIGAGVAVLIFASNAIARRRNNKSGPPAAEPITVPEGYAKLTVRRPSIGLSGALRSLKIVVDDKAVGRVKSGKATAVAVLPGRHSLVLKFGSKPSEVGFFDATAGSNHEFEIEMQVGSIPLRMDLREVPPSDSPQG